MYTSVLQAKEASVAVHMHVRVCSFEELQAKFWMVEVVASGDQALHLRLVPASRQAIPTCTVLALKQYGEILSVEFVPAQRIFTSPLLFARRHMRAAREASRRAACV